MVHRKGQEKSPGFGSSKPRVVGTNEDKYTPGPGFYNAQKQNSSFNADFLKSIEDKEVYYLVKNGTLTKKQQGYAVSKSTARPEQVTKEALFKPGPGAYSPEDYTVLARVQNRLGV
jgi:hypothetical protein